MPLECNLHKPARTELSSQPGADCADLQMNLQHIFLPHYVIYLIKKPAKPVLKAVSMDMVVFWLSPLKTEVVP